MVKLYYHKLLDPLIQQAEQQREVLIINGEDFNAEDLWKDAQVIAQNLAESGVKEDQRVVLAFEAGTEFLKVIYACILLRLKVAIIDPEMGRELYAVKLRQLKPDLAFVDSRLMLLQEHPVARFLYFKLVKKSVYFPPYKGLKVIAVGKRLPILKKVTWFKKYLKPKTSNFKLIPAEEDHDLLIVYTSGTLQEPKGVLLSLNALSESIDRLKDVLKARPNDRIATYLPHFLLLGIATAVPVYYYNLKWSTKKKLQFFTENKINILFGPPSDYLPLIKYAESNNEKLPASFTHLLIGSAPVHPSFLQKLYNVCHSSTEITCTYGMTENLLVTTIDGKIKMNYAGEGDPVGKPVKNVELKIAEDGEILLRSPQLYSRYYHLNKRADFHATGDLGFMDSEGNLFLKGRKKEMIIRRNTNIYPTLYEKTIKRIPGIDEAAMVGIFNHEKQDEEVFLAVEGSIKLTEKQILEKLKFGQYQIDGDVLPDKVIFMKIPRKGRQNKIDRAEIVNQINRNNR